MLLEKERREIVETCLFMQNNKLVVGTAGNVSIRVDDKVAISPSGVPYETMTAEDVVVFSMDGERVDGILEPSSELPLHLSVYRKTAAKSITHNHAPASTALGLVVDEIPPSHYYSAMLGGIIRVAPYAEFGTDELTQRDRRFKRPQRGTDEKPRRHHHRTDREEGGRPSSNSGVHLRNPPAGHGDRRAHRAAFARANGRRQGRHR